VSAGITLPSHFRGNAELQNKFNIFIAFNYELVTIICDDIHEYEDINKKLVKDSKARYY
jgi:hypothetical protein